MFHNSQAVASRSARRTTTRSSRRRSGSTTSTSRAKDSTTRSATSRWSASPRRRCIRGEKPSETWFAPLELRRHGPPRGRLLADHRGPSSRENRVTLDTRRQHRDQLYGRPTTNRGEQAVPPLKYDPQPHRDAPRSPPAARLLPGHDISRRGGRAPGRDLPVRRRPGRPRCSTRTARPTSWTTSTWWTPASSPASAR